MRYSQLFSKTKRDAPADLSDETLRLAFRAGLIRPAAQGQLFYLPLAANVIAQMLMMLRGELKELGAQEIRGAPHVQLDALASAEIQSYKQLPARIYWRSGGVTRLHLASLESNLDAAQETLRAFEKIARDFFAYAGIEPKTAQDVDSARVWYVLQPQIGLEILASAAYAATRAAATPMKTAGAIHESPLPMQEIETPHCDTIEALAQFLNVPTSRTAKAIFYSTGDDLTSASSPQKRGENRVIFAVIRGDLQMDEDKVKRALGVQTLRWATDDEIKRVGAAPGYASPVGTRGATIIVDDSIAASPNLVAGANKAGYHLLNTNVPRDYKPDVITDIALARVGDMSPDNSGTLELARGAAVGKIFAPRALDANFLDMNGKAQKQIAVVMELDLGATLLAHLGAHRDEKGITWTRALAPFDAYIVALNADKPEVANALEKVDFALSLAGLDCFIDDRNESAGVKFNDADLVGLPLRITVGPKTVAQNSVELKARTEASARVVALDALESELNKWIGI